MGRCGSTARDLSESCGDLISRAEAVPLERDSAPVNLLEKALGILALFTPEQPTWGVAAVAREVGIPKSTVYRILRIFQRHGYLHQDPETKKFRLGLAALQLGRSAHESIELRQAAARVLEELSDRSGETVLLEVLTDERDRVVCIERAQQRSGLRIILEVGATAPLHAGSSAKVLLAHMTTAEIERVLAGDLAALTPRTLTDPGVLRLELERIRRDGYAVSLEEMDIGVAGVSVPIRDYAGDVVAGLTIAGPIARLQPIEKYVEMAQDASRKIARQLGHGDGASTAALSRGLLTGR